MSDMVDIIRAIKNILDVHGAWVFGGTLAAGLIAHKSRKQKSLDSEWTYVKCIGCGRAGYSDEMRSGQDASGKEHYSCARCSRPDLFRQAEGVDYSTTVYRVRFQDLNPGAINRDGGMTSLLDTDDPADYHYRTAERAMKHINMILDNWSYYDWKELAPRGKRRTWKSGKADMKMMFTPVKLGNVVREAEGDRDLKRCHVCGDLTKTETVELEVCERHTTSDFGYNYPDHEMGAEESFEDFRRRMVGDAAIAGDMGYMEALEEYYQDYLEEFEKMRDELCPDPKTFEQFQEMVLKDDFAASKFMAEGGDKIYMVQHISRDRYDPYSDDATVYADPHEAIKHWEAIMVQNGRDPRSYEKNEFDPNWRFYEDNRGITMVSEIPLLDEFAIMGFQNFEMLDDHGFLEQPPWSDLYYTIDEDLDVSVGMEAEDYGVGAVWMADSYDPAIHGNTIPTGSVKRFLEKIPVGQMFHVQFVKSNGDIREMDAFFNKPYSPDSMTANVMERTATGAVFKRFRVDRVVGLYRV